MGGFLRLGMYAFKDLGHELVLTHALSGSTSHHLGLTLLTFCLEMYKGATFLCLSFGIGLSP